ncbi:MarR family winged helix-turn-helix transcriptional regulator [Aestuariispira insulae]|nr:MarR family transcriptional regulator [Aestuariispira insulae]
MRSIMAQWKRERPDIDPTPMAICGQVWRAADRLRAGVMDNLKQYDLDFPGMDVLLTLRRNGKGAALSPSVLAKDMMLSTSAMTNRLDRLEKRGLVQRQSDPGDRRALKITLTAEGQTLADELVVTHTAREASMLAALSEEEQALLCRLLAKAG